MTDTAYSDVFYAAPDGLKLHARVYGEDHDGRLPVICLPGLTRNHRDFHELALMLSSDREVRRRVVVFDYRGRGLSDYDPDWRNYDVMVEAADIMAGLTALDIAHGAFIGTSRGGLIIFAIAAMRPAALRAVVLNDVGPVIGGGGLAQIRGYLEHAPKPATFAEATAILRAALGKAFPILSEEDWQRQAKAIYREQDGRPVADFDPALLKTLAGIDLNEPLPELWPQFHGLAGIPVLALRGAHSALLSAETLEEMAQRHPDIETLTVDGQGHAPLLETGGLPARISAFLERAERRAPA